MALDFDDAEIKLLDHACHTEIKFNMNPKLALELLMR